MACLAGSKVNIQHYKIIGECHLAILQRNWIISPHSQDWLMVFLTKQSLTVCLFSLATRAEAMPTLLFLSLSRWTKICTRASLHSTNCALTLGNIFSLHMWNTFSSVLNSTLSHYFCYKNCSIIYQELLLVICNATAVYKLFVLNRNTWKIELLMFNSNTWKCLAVSKYMSSNNLFKNKVTYKLFTHNSYI